MKTKSAGLSVEAVGLISKDFSGKERDNILRNMGRGFASQKSVFVEHPEVAEKFALMASKYRRMPSVIAELSDLFGEDHEHFTSSKAKSLINTFDREDVLKLFGTYGTEPKEVWEALAQVLFEAACKDLKGQGKGKHLERVMELSESNEIAITLNSFKDAPAIDHVSILIFQAVATEDAAVVGKICSIVDEFDDVPSAIKHIEGPTEFVETVRLELAQKRMLRQATG